MIGSSYPVVVLVVAATNRPGALSIDLAHYYADMLTAKGQAAEALDLTGLPSDLIVSALYDQRGKNETFNRLQRRLETVDKYAFIVPEYNRSFPGVFKSFIDGLPFPSFFLGKKGVLVGVSNGPGGAALALSHLTDILHYGGMYIHPTRVMLRNITDSRLETVLANASYVKLLSDQATALLHF